MDNILEEIITLKRTEVCKAKEARPFEVLAEQLHAAPPVRDFVNSLSTHGPVGMIAEVKKASPSAGLIREDFQPVEIAQIYETSGAACISVLTDEHYFQGHLNYLKEVRNAVAIPVLRKDFIIDRYQILEARITGADCVLLIAECLDECELEQLYAYALELGMSALVEIYEPKNLKRVLKLSPPMLGINNRNLKTFVTTLDHSIQLSAKIPADCLLISESGIRNRQDVLRLQSAGVRGILVGETLMRAPDISEKVKELLEVNV
ncbi:MAG: indole-3-glycerol phosphate synthase TrpC [Planctomycetes bacterium]|nr:indole-3-glycerol phosphate synthase TrpC [Planctomycetota bacterium]MCH9725658.1 indole-3-glycerol phosphate synthase TrpC [Planctomycetota bacterium]MCH9777712.1 indole-3-glycerol phosphate synthase TrpC [Planctomycetota bacterium]MCH9793642.1 indole-3-glycerol phosphate synthase TrpC [Planctomycetota bacterium]